jgi:hypothetical protein
MPIDGFNAWIHRGDGQEINAASTVIPSGDGSQAPGCSQAHLSSGQLHTFEEYRRMDLSFEHAVITHAAHYAYDTVNPLGKVEADK